MAVFFTILNSLSALFQNEKFWQVIASFASVLALFFLYKQINESKKANAYVYTSNSKEVFFSEK